MKLSAILALLGVTPKNPEEAKQAREESRQALDSVASLFSAAGLNLEQMLAAGPDALKAHIASLDRTAEFAALQGQLTTAQASVTDLTAKFASEQSAHSVTAEALKVHAETLATVGFKADAKDKDGKPVEFKQAFASHVEKQAAALLAKDGRPPVANAAPVFEATLSDDEIVAKYQAMPAGPERLEFHTKHSAALFRANKK
jgi:hypothetical protein